MCFPYAAHKFRSVHFEYENDHICPYVTHMLDNIWATYNLVVFENTLHIGHIWAAYEPHMACPYAAHMSVADPGGGRGDVPPPPPPPCRQNKSMVTRPGFVKSDHRSTMSEGCMNALLRLYVHKDIQLDFEEVVTTYGEFHAPPPPPPPLPMTQILDLPLYVAHMFWTQ